jgi:UDP-galactopyranose mutase
MEHIYGPHIFNTDRLDLWEYIQQFSKFGNYTNRVKAITHKGIFSLPINLLTINQFFGKTFNPREAKEFLHSLGDHSIKEPHNFEEQALKMVGKDLYEAFFRGYTIKQWGTDPKNLPASILKRLPVRFNYDDNYYHSKYQGIPLDGYTRIVERILDAPGIEVQLNTTYTRDWNDDFDHVFYTGPLDAYFNHTFGRLGYRTIFFERHRDTGDYQGNPVLNYCEENIPYTRVHEHKHFTPWEHHEKTLYQVEYSKETGTDDVPYYPKRLPDDKALLAKYRQLAEEERKVFFLGRLATYRYMDMHHVIGEALDLAKKLITTDQPWEMLDRFPNQEH